MLVDGDHLVITIQSRIDHLANLTLEGSSDRKTWHSGPEHKLTVVDDLEALVVRGRGFAGKVSLAYCAWDQAGDSN